VSADEASDSPVPSDRGGSGGAGSDGAAPTAPQLGGAGSDGAAPTAPQLARAAVEAALARRAGPRRKPGAAGATGAGPGAGVAGGRRLRGYSGSGPDPRDPQPLAAVLARLVKARGWQQPAAQARVFAEWDKVVGADVAAHCRPVKLERGELTVEAESTTWATQLRLLATRLLARIAGEIGSGVVIRLHIHGPAAPSWSRGPRRVRGRGPRDTYG
jgi:predicted nucleic acid-binding Zn ribbon protein